jgi:hypothetical protein
LLGASMLGHFAMLFAGLNAPQASTQPMVRGHLMFDVVGLVVSIMAVTSGALNVLGWSIVAIFGATTAVRAKLAV